MQDLEDLFQSRLLGVEPGLGNSGVDRFRVLSHEGLGERFELNEALVGDLVPGGPIPHMVQDPMGPVVVFKGCSAATATGHARTTSRVRPALLALPLVAESVAVSPVVRSEGLTPSERYLKRLCDRSFLTLWSYPNLYIDKGKAQELCDLLVVFDRHVIIFSDKSCRFPDTGNLKTDWQRWFRRSVAKSAKQVFGAERWIRSHSDRIFLDPQCKERFPLAFPPPDEIIFHRIVVALGAGERCRNHFGGSGSLMLMPPVQVGESGDAWPFAAGDVSPDKGYVHVLDDVTLDIVLGELDTVADFTEYLGEKERLIRSGRLISAAGEEDVLAYYLQNIIANRHVFLSPEATEAMVIDEGFWADLEGNQQYLAKKELDKVSYVWDALIESFNKNIAAGSLASGNEHGINALETAVRIMASEPRVARRMFGEAIMETVEKTPPDGENTRFMARRERPTVGYVFILQTRQMEEDYGTYRARRSKKLEAYCQ